MAKTAKNPATSTSKAAVMTSGTRYINYRIESSEGKIYKSSIAVQDSDVLTEVFESALSMNDKSKLNQALATAVLENNTNKIDQIRNKLLSVPSKALTPELLGRFTKKQLIEMFTAAEADIGGVQIAANDFDDMA